MANCSTKHFSRLIHPPSSATHPLTTSQYYTSLTPTCSLFQDIRIYIYIYIYEGAYHKFSKYINVSSCFFVTKETSCTVLCCCSPNTQSNKDLKTSHKPIGWAKESGKRLDHRLACEATNTILYEDDGNGPQTEEDCPHYQESQGT